MSPMVPILPWEIHNYSNKWTFDIEEIDLAVEHTEKKNLQSKHNLNFSHDATFGTTTKLGIKLGATAEFSDIYEFTSKWTEQSDKLGQVTVDFGENVIIGTSGGEYAYRNYASGKYSLTLRPFKVQ